MANQSLLQIRRRLAHQLTTDFLGVSNIKVHATEIEKISCDRLTAHYEPALRMARLILAAMGIAHESGGVRSNGFLLNMNSLFEKFIAHRIRRLLRHDGILVQMQQQFDFDEQGQAKIQPDLVIQSPRGQRVVVDTKYKDRSNADAGDLYQMLAYCRVLRVRRGVLITVGQAPRRCYRVRDGASQIDVIPVNLDGSITDINASVDQLVAFIREQVASRPIGSSTESASDNLTRY